MANNANNVLLVRSQPTVELVSVLHADQELNQTLIKLNASFVLLVHSPLVMVCVNNVHKVHTLHVAVQLSAIAVVVVSNRLTH